MQPYLCQLALTTKHPEICKEFYRQLLGYRDSGKQNIRGIAASRIFDCEKVFATCDWLCGDDPFFQIEIFNFQQPESIDNPLNMFIGGYNIIFIEAPDINQLLTNKFISSNLSQVCRYSHNGSDHLLARDIDNNFLDVFSNIKSRSLEKPAFRGIGATVNNLEKELRNFTIGFGLTECETPETFDPLFKRTETSPNGKTSARRCKTINSGLYKIQLTEFTPCLNEEQKKLTDQGILNIALGIRDNTEFKPLFDRLLETGYTPVIKPVGDNLTNTVYLKTESLSVEFLQLPEQIQPDWGFPALYAISA